MVPAVAPRVWRLSLIAFIVRLAFVCFLVLSGHPKAALELGYTPALVADFPISLLYPHGPMSGPTLAAIVGPIRWFLLPILVWRLIWGRREKPSRHAI